MILSFTVSGNISELKESFLALNCVPTGHMIDIIILL